MISSIQSQIYFGNALLVTVPACPFLIHAVTVQLRCRGSSDFAIAQHVA